MGVRNEGSTSEKFYYEQVIGISRGQMGKVTGKVAWASGGRLDGNFYLTQQTCNNFRVFTVLDEDAVTLTLKEPNKNCSRRHFNFLLLSFVKIRLDFSCQSSA